MMDDHHGHWSELNSDILSLIINKLTQLVDAIHFSSVCAQWNIIFKTFIKTRKHLPLLLLHDDTNETLEFLSITDGKSYAIPIPNFDPWTMCCLGASNGWLIIADAKYTLHIVQPLAGHQIDLPHITTIPFINYHDSFDLGICSDKGLWLGRPSDMWVYFEKVALLSPGPSPESATVMIIHDSMLSFTRVGDGAWTVLREDSEFEDLIVHEGKFHTLIESGMVEVWEPNGNTFTPRCVGLEFRGEGDLESTVQFENDNPQDFDGIFNRMYDPNLLYSDSSYYLLQYAKLLNESTKYLVESANGEQLMMVIRACYWNRQTRKCALFKVFMSDKEKRKWVHIKSLGDQVLFVGEKGSICHNACVSPELLSDCIYFAEQDEVIVGDFHMQDNFAEPLKSLESKQIYQLPNLWFTPKIY